MCSVCLDLVQAPVDCTQCQNLLCERCLAAIQSVCPNKCGQGFVPVARESRPDLFELMRLVKLRCTYAQCEEVLDMASYREHQQVCEFNRDEINCPSRGCQYKALDSLELEEHIQYACKYAQFPCKYACGRLLYTTDVETHERDHCPLKPEDCPLGCGATPHRAKLQDHLTLECELRTYRCSACATTLKPDERKAHSCLDILS